MEHNPKPNSCIQRRINCIVDKLHTEYKVEGSEKRGEGNFTHILLCNKNTNERSLIPISTLEKMIKGNYKAIWNTESTRLFFLLRPVNKNITLTNSSINDDNLLLLL